MSYNLQIQFSGLCAFVPSGDLDKTPSFRVLLVNTNSDTNKVANLTGGDCASHYPILEFPLANVAPAVNSAIASAMVPWDLTGLELQLSFQGQTSGGVTVDLSGGAGIGEVPKDDESDATDFRWVPLLEEILPACQGIDQSMLLFPPGNSAVTARIALTDGALSVVNVSNFNGDPVVAHFAPEAGARIISAVSKTVALQIAGITGPVTISAFNFADQSTAATLLLTPTQDGTGNDQDIVVRVSNLCPDEYSAIGEASPEIPESDKDFAWLYALTKGIGALAPDKVIDPAKFPIPIPIKYTTSSVEGGGEPIKCASARTNPAQ